MNFSAVILAGGKSLRMGRDKAFLPIDGQPLLARQIALVRAVGAREVFVSGRLGTDYTQFGCPVLPDKFENAGPLAGIERALNSITMPLLLALAVDLPAMNVSFLQQLCALCRENFGVIPRLNHQIEPLAAFYPRATHSIAEKLLANQTNAVAGFAEHCVQSQQAAFSDIPNDQHQFFANWNSPGDITMAVESLKS